MLEVVVPHGQRISKEHFQPLLEAGIGKEAIKEVLNTAWCFINLSKWADALDFDLNPENQLKFAGKMLLKKGYGGASLPTPFDT